MMQGKKLRIREKIRRSKVPLNPHMLASCYNKLRLTRDDAEKKATELGNNTKFYKCKYCGFFHVGRTSWKNN